MSKVISIANFKGGVLKTTSSTNIGAGLANRGHSVLLIDLDPQFNLTQSLGVDNPPAPIYGALKGEYPLKPIEIYKGLDIVPSSLDLIKAQIELSHEFKREEKLSHLIAPIVENYDYIILDCPPSLGVLTINAFVASNFIFVPVAAEFLALKGYAVLSEALDKVGLGIDKVFITKYDRRKIINRNVVESLRENLDGKLFETIIRDNIALAEAPTQGVDIFRYAPKSTGAQDYGKLTEEILQELNK